MAPSRIPQNLDNLVGMSTQTFSLDSRLQPLFFIALNSNGSNFLDWLNDAKTVLSAENLASTLNVKEVVDLPLVCKWQAKLILRRYLVPSLRLQYILVDDPTDLWSQLYARFRHQQILFLP